MNETGNTVFFSLSLTACFAYKPPAFDSPDKYAVSCRFDKDGFFSFGETIPQEALIHCADLTDMCTQELQWLTKGKDYSDDKFADRWYESIYL